MSFNVATYNPRHTPVHALDARVKILLVIAFSVTLFCVHTWWGLGVLAVVAGVAALLAGLDVRRTVRSLAPIGIILLITLVTNSFTFDVGNYYSPASGFFAPRGHFEHLAPLALVGNFGLVPAGVERGCYYIVRIVLLLVASLVLTTSTSSTELSAAVRSLLRPLERIGVPTYDIATVVSLALRFIPVTIGEFQQLRMAQTARGASFDTGGILQRLKAWVTVLIPLFVGLYRRADNLSIAMDARCYGGSHTTQLTVEHMGRAEIVLLCLLLLLYACIGIWG